MYLKHDGEPETVIILKHKICCRSKIRFERIIKGNTLATFILVHGAWHNGEHLEVLADHIRNSGNEVFLPTLVGNRENDDKSTGLEEAISSLLDFIENRELSDFILVGHSYAGMIITGIADRAPALVRRLIYWNAFVPLDGESLNDLVPESFLNLWSEVLKPDGSVLLPYAVWRDRFINDATTALALSTFKSLNSQPLKTFSDKISLTKNPSEITIPKAYINATEDTCFPHAMNWHPRLSEKLGLFRLIQLPGSHEVCFTNPSLLAKKIMLGAED